MHDWDWASWPHFLGLEGQDSLGPAFLFSTRYPLGLVLRELLGAFPFLNIWQEEGGVACSAGEPLYLGVLAGVEEMREEKEAIEPFTQE